MEICCRHGEDEHETVTICEEQIHYPSEDYPCFCEELVTEKSAEICGGCGHRTEKHLVTRSCKPRSAEPCDCRSVTRRHADIRPV